ncbi:MAG: phenylalanine--tRNA ligase subunit beta [Chloroflexota bacterium]|nr:phenylalanine--tRNA ligase subunit beta [Chloroflexota bacterium]
MKAPLKWLSRYVELDRDADELAALLNDSGTEVEAVHRLGAEWQSLSVAEIVKIEKHPNADRLSLATVTTGSGTLTVVCGAPNIAVGQKVPFAPVGANIQGHILEARPIRGIRSEGMLCAPDELGLSPDHSGILILAPTETPGTPLDKTLGDVVLQLEIKPGRADCLSIIGVAREVAALTGQTLRLPARTVAESGTPIAGRFRLRIEAPDLCPRFVARLATGVAIAPSPWWMQSLLNAAGVRSINNVVDVTNFIMLEWGKPIHAYDYDYLRGREIIVRRAQQGEKLTTLDGLERELEADMVVIADAEGGIGLGGVMGGADSEVKEGTRNILLESANFDALTMRRTAKKLGMHSEAVRRFERGVDPEVTAVAADHACYWFAELAGATIAPGSVEIDTLGHQPRVIDFDSRETGRLLGKEYGPDHCARVLVNLGFALSGHRVTVPPWRLDVRQPADLVEEVARITGYDDLPVTMPDGDIPVVAAQDPAQTRRLAVENRLRELVKGAGFSETVTYSLLSEQANSRCVAIAEEPFEAPSLLTSLFIEPIKLANAMSEEQQYLRTSLLPSILQVYDVNRRHTALGLKLFEIGRVYWQRLDDLPQELTVLALLLAGPWEPRGWRGQQRPVDFADMKGSLELLFDRLNVAVRYTPAEHPSLHPGRCAQVAAGHQLVGYLGELHPTVREKLDLPTDPVFVAELDVDTLANLAGPVPRYRALARFPSIGRQLTVAIAADTTAEKVQEVIAKAGGELLVETMLADVFQLPDGRRSLSYAFTLQSDDRTLTDEEANAVSARIMDALGRQVGAVQR